MEYATDLVSNYTQYTTEYSQADHEYFYFTNSLNDIKYSFPKHIMSHLYNTYVIKS